MHKSKIARKKERKSYKKEEKSIPTNLWYILTFSYNFYKEEQHLWLPIRISVWQNPSKRGPTPKGKNLASKRSKFFLLDVNPIPIKNGDRNENDRVSSPVSIHIHRMK